MKRCWIHIGMHKTGTTSVQKGLAKIKKSKNWKILKVGGSPNMGPSLHAMFATDAHKFHWFVKEGKGPKKIAKMGARLRERMRDVIIKSEVENIIISAEALTLLDYADVVSMQKFLAPYFDEIRIIGYIRPPIAYKMSMFQQQVKHGKSNFLISGTKLNYRKRFEKYDEIFGKENVILKKFDPSSFPNSCIIADFSKEIGITLPEKHSFKKANTSLSREACGMLYAYRKFGPGYGVGKEVVLENKYMILPLMAMEGKKFKVSKAVAIDSIAQEHEDILWAEGRLGQSLAENVEDEGTEVQDEKDLLTISRSSCEAYAAKFEEIHKIPVSLNNLPAGDPVDPAKVASFMEYCRGLCRQKIQAMKP